MLEARGLRVALLTGIVALLPTGAHGGGEVLLELPGQEVGLGPGLDFDGDRVPDVLVVDGSGARVARVISGATGTVLAEFPDPDGDPLVGTGITAARIVADMTGDSRPDVLLGVSRGVRSTNPPAVAVLLDGATRTVVWESSGDHPFERYGVWVEPIGDITGDGRGDVAVCGDNVVRVLSGADGTRLPGFEQRPDFTTTFSLGFPRAAALGDVDGDDVPDLLIGFPRSGTADPAVTTGEARVVSGADGRVVRRHAGTRDLEIVGRSVAALGDLDRDGVTDYAVTANGRKRTGEVVVYSGRRGRRLLRVQGGDLGLQTIGASVAAVGDVDRDGLPDLVTDGRGDDSATVLIVLSASAFQGPPAFQLNPGDNEFLGGGYAGCGDIDGDGVPDLLTGTGNGLVRIVRLEAAVRLPDKLALRSALQRGDGAAAGASALLTIGIRKGRQSFVLQTRGVVGSAAPGPFGVHLEDGVDAGTFTVIGTLGGSGDYFAEGDGSVPPGLGVGSLADLPGRRVQVRDDTGAVVLETVVPALVAAGKAKGKLALEAADGSPEPDAKLVLKVVFDPRRGALALKGKVKKGGSGPFALELESAPGSGDFVVVAELSGSKLKLSTATGAPLAGAFTLDDLAGRRVRVVTGDEVVLEGTF